MNPIIYWNRSREPRIVFRGTTKLSKSERIALRKFLRANAITGAIITDLAIPEGAKISLQEKNVMTMAEVRDLFMRGKVRMI